MHSTSFRISDMTIHRVVESEAPFMDAMEFLPGLTPKHSTSIGLGWSRPRWIR